MYDTADIPDGLELSEMEGYDVRQPVDPADAPELMRDLTHVVDKMT